MEGPDGIKCTLQIILSRFLNGVSLCSFNSLIAISPHMEHLGWIFISRGNEDFR